MATLDADRIRQLTQGGALQGLARVEVFDEIDSTNSYLMQRPMPAAGTMTVAASTNQVAGRGRHGKTWEAPAGSGLALSAAYTFAKEPPHLSALTLAIGLSAVAALDDLGYRDIKVKWPNDLVANNGKLAGILTEVQQRSNNGVSVVSGVGLNVDMPDDLVGSIVSEWSSSPTDLKSLGESLPDVNLVAATFASAMYLAFHEFDTQGFGGFASRWSEVDWLSGQQLTANGEAGEISGVGAGIADDGALLVTTEKLGVQRVTTGSITL